jgi:transcriptional regulator with XRE-family HTH domain
VSPEEQHPLTVARLARGWRLVDLAEAVGKSAPLICMMEGGYRGKLATREAIAEALGVPITSIWPDDAVAPQEGLS